MGEIHKGHVLDVLRGLPENSVDCVVTSPPYWGLRDYKIEPQVWDAVDGCEHEWGEEIIKNQTGGIATGSLGSGNNEDDRIHYRASDNFCLRCGAWRGSLGLEPTPELFVSHIVQVFAEVRRVLKPTGVCFVNLGDSYAQGQGKHSSDEQAEKLISEIHEQGYSGGGLTGWAGRRAVKTAISGLKPKDLCMIPARVALALQSDGWWLRSEIVWAKPNPMPESVTDRPTKAHEMIYLLTKSAKYFWNQESVREPHLRDWSKEKWTQQRNYGDKESSMGQEHGGNKTISETFNPSGRNIRSVWTFATEPTPEAHFATFPQELVKRCILAGTSEHGCCPTCGKPWEPVVEPSENYKKLLGRDLLRKNEHDSSEILEKGWSQKKSAPSVSAEYKLTGWRPTCSCGEEKTVPAVVLDPFIGSGTTGIVAENLNRRWVGIELNPEYISIAEKRLKAKANTDQENFLKIAYCQNV